MIGPFQIIRFDTAMGVVLIQIFLVHTTRAISARTVAALRPRLRLVDVQIPSVHFLVIKTADSRDSFRLVVHFDEGEPFGPSGVLVRNNVDAGNFAKSGERVAQLVFGGVVRHVADVDFHYSTLRKLAYPEIDRGHSYDHPIPDK